MKRDCCHHNLINDRPGPPIRRTSRKHLFFKGITHCADKGIHYRDYSYVEKRKRKNAGSPTYSGLEKNLNFFSFSGLGGAGVGRGRGSTFILFKY